jgi:hypothetical protein
MLGRIDIIMRGRLHPPAFPPASSAESSSVRLTFYQFAREFSFPRRLFASRDREPEQASSRPPIPAQIPENRTEIAMKLHKFRLRVTTLLFGLASFALSSFAADHPLNFPYGLAVDAVATSTLPT